jgi:ubiquinone/menaquinone biosynthesis C-methylase UbiE
MTPLMWSSATVVLIAAGLAAPFAAAETQPPQTQPAQTEHQHSHGSQTQPAFVVPEHSFADVDRWVTVFDDPARSEWQMPERLVAALGLKAGSVVADIGAGTGYFIGHLAKAVAPGGRVLAVDLEPNMVSHMRERADKEGVAGVETILAAPDDPHIPAGSTDCILMVDTYHHIHERVAYLRRLQGALAKGGRVVVVDFHKEPLPVGPPPEHKMTREEIVAEFEEAGYRLAKEETFLPYQYFLRFEVGAGGR